MDQNQIGNVPPTASFQDWPAAIRDAEALWKAGKISREDYQRVIAEWKASQEQQQQPAAPGQLTAEGLANASDKDFAAALTGSPDLVERLLGRPGAGSAQ